MQDPGVTATAACTTREWLLLVQWSRLLRIITALLQVPSLEGQSGTLIGGEASARSAEGRR